MKNFEIWYTARDIYNKGYSEGEILSWNNYIQWSKLYHLDELVSLDSMLNPVIVDSDFNNLDDWNSMIIENSIDTGFFSTLEFVLQKTKSVKRFNLLAVTKNPAIDCKEYRIKDFDFLGYDLLDLDYEISALSNCGGFDETFLPNELNNLGLISNYEKAFDIKDRLCKNNPQEHHAFTNVIGIWRHKIIGR